jgi:hypothetical protein
MSRNQAADYLRVEIGQDNGDIEWVAVRPDTLVDDKEVTEHEEYPFPTWTEWKGRMPVIYNSARS